MPFITCLDSIPTFLRIFDPSVAPTLLYYAYVPVILMSLFLGAYILIKDRFSLKSLYFFLIAVSFSLWILNIIFQWVIVYANMSLFSWQITAIIEVFIPISVLYFYHNFIYDKKPPQYLRWLVYIAIIGTSSLLATRYNMPSFSVSQCQAHVGPLLYALAFFEILISLILSIDSYKLFRNKTFTDSKKKQALILGLSSAVFLIVFALSNLFGLLTEIYQINLFGPIGAVIFIGFVFFMIVHYGLFNIKLIATQALVLGISILIGSQLFSPSSITDELITGSTLAAFLVAGFYLIRSVKREIEAKEALAVANKKLEAFDILKSKFLSLASHQLRSPISVIKSCISLFLEGQYGEISELQRKTLNMLFQKAEDMNEDVEKYLIVAKIDQGGLQYNLAKLDMSDLVGKMTEGQKIIAKNKGLDLSFETDGNSPYFVNGDKIQLKQVVQNLIDNAMKFTKEGWIKVNLSKDQKAKKIRLVVSDSGRGIKPEIIPTLFKEFSRGDGAQVDAGGSGIGLYAVKEIVEKGHNGKVWVESKGDGKGSIFTVELSEIL